MLYFRCMIYRPKHSLGFTLVELLIAISILGVLAAVTYSRLNYVKTSQNTTDALERADIQKLVSGVESYRLLEGVYPTSSADATLANYIQGGWLDDEPKGAHYTYATDASRLTFGIISTTSTGTFYKYRSEWGQIKTCNSPCVASDTVCN